MTIVDLTHVIDWSREALRMALLLGGPHEPVVGLVPRLVAVLLVLLAILPWLVGRWVSFTVDLIGSIPDLL